MIEDLITQNIIVHIIVIFAVVEGIKKLIIKPNFDTPKGTYPVLAVMLGIAAAFGWDLSLLPEPALKGFHGYSHVLTGIVVGLAAVGLFAFIDDLLPDLNI